MRIITSMLVAAALIVGIVILNERGTQSQISGNDYQICMLSGRSDC